jgi:hypothetical protein
LQSAPEKVMQPVVMGKSAQPYAPPSLNTPSPPKAGKQGEFPAMPAGHRGMSQLPATATLSYQHTHPMAPSYLKGSTTTNTRALAPSNQEGISPQASQELDELLEKVPAGYATPVQEYN